MTQKSLCNLIQVSLSRLMDYGRPSSFLHSISVGSAKSSMNFHDFMDAVSSFWNIPSPVLYQANFSLWKKAWASSSAWSYPAPFSSLPTFPHPALAVHCMSVVSLHTHTHTHTPNLSPLSSSCPWGTVTAFYLCICRAWHIKNVQWLIKEMKWKSEIAVVNEKKNAPIIWLLNECGKLLQKTLHSVKVENYSKDRPEAMMILF